MLTTALAATTSLLPGHAFAADTTPPETIHITSLEIVPWEPSPTPVVFPPFDQDPILRIKGPRKFEVARRKARITFWIYRSEPVTLECKVDSSLPEPCASPFTTRRLWVGHHRLWVRGTDTGGNQAVVSERFQILRKARR